MEAIEKVFKDVYGQVASKQGQTHKTYDKDALNFAKLFAALPQEYKLQKIKEPSKEVSKLKCVKLIPKKDGSLKPCNKLVKDMKYSVFCPTHTTVCESVHPQVFLANKLPKPELYTNITESIKKAHINVVLSSNPRPYYIYLIYCAPYEALVFYSSVNSDGQWNHGLLGKLEFLDGSGKFIRECEDLSLQYKIRPYVNTSSKDPSENMESIIEYITLEKDKIVMTI
jgi:hypothetical protein